MIEYFAFEQSDPDGQSYEFVFALRDPSKIAEARSILADPLATRVHVQGTIVREQAAYNPAWSFHLDPDSIGFFELQMEVCDANVTYVEQHLSELGEATLPNLFWCPWSSRISREVGLHPIRSQRK